MTRELLKLIALATLTVVCIALVNQYRKPTWWPGWIFLWMMNSRHSPLTDWGLTHVRVEKPFTILDVGCGGGRTIRKLAALVSEGKVYGIDYSAASVAVARRTNVALIEAGRVEIQHGSVSRLPFPDATFDLVSAVETHYYWPTPVADMREILRVLKPGGSLVIIAEAYKGRRFDTLYQPAMKLLRATYLTVREHHELLAAAGYAAIEVREERRKGWLCAVGTRPAQVAAQQGTGADAALRPQDHADFKS
jgi:SAM-dependent methyltransferase